MHVVRAVLRVVVFDDERGALHDVVMRLVPLGFAPPGEIDVADAGFVDVVVEYGPNGVIGRGRRPQEAGDAT